MKIAKSIPLFFVLSLYLGATITMAETPIQIRINGEYIHIPADEQQPVIVDGRTLVPVRGVFQWLGFMVEWFDVTRTVSISRPRQRILVRIDDSYMELHNGEVIRLDVPAQILNGRTMIPVRAIAEATGFLVEWDHVNRIIDIIDTTEPIAFYTWPINTSNWPEHLLAHEPGSIILHPEIVFSSLIDLSTPMEFRAIFYNIPGVFGDLIPGEYRQGWRERANVASTGYLDNMMLASFVQYFHISREVFDIALARLEYYYIQMGADMSDEWYELPNADIIFTFDRDIIRYFYRRQ